MSDSSPLSDPLLRVEGLTTRFRTDDGTLLAVEDVSFDVERGETVCLVGESGSGKTVASESITRLIEEPPGEIAGGAVRFDGRDLLSASESELRAVRGGRIAHIFQNPRGALNPVYTIGWQLIEAVRLHADVPKDRARARAIDLLDRVGVPDPGGRIDDYPHELSGGQTQRVAIAMALAGEPDLLIADEPTTALDVTTQAQVLDLLEEIQSEFGMAVLFVTHDLGVVAEIADRVVVLYAGSVMERGGVFDVFERPSHPYTRALLDSVPGGRGVSRDTGASTPHSPPIRDALSTPPDSQTGCRFHDQCPHAVDGCAVGGQPPLYDVPAATVSGPDRAEGEGCPDRSAADRERASKGNDEHVAACVHFAPEGDPSAVYGSGNDSVRGDDADGGRPVGREGER